MKKIASLLLAVVMLVSLASGMGISAFAADVFVTDDGIRYVENYVENGENTVKIVGYSGKGAEIVIPNTISGKKVTRISNFSFNDNTIVKSLSVPASVTEIDDMVILNCPNITAIKVASDNKYYDSRNNCNAIIEKATGTLIAGCKSTKVPNGTYKLIKTTSSTSFTTAVAAKGKTYSYKIRAVTSKNKNATSNYSKVVSAKRK